MPQVVFGHQEGGGGSGGVCECPVQEVGVCEVVAKAILKGLE